MAVALQIRLVEEDLRGSFSSDMSAAVRVYQDELSGALHCMEDSRIAGEVAKSVDKALAADLSALQVFERLEKLEAEDRAYALSAFEKLEEQESNDRTYAKRAFERLEEQEASDRAFALNLHQEEVAAAAAAAEECDAPLCDAEGKGGGFQPKGKRREGKDAEDFDHPLLKRQRCTSSDRSDAHGAKASSSGLLDCDICMEKHDRAGIFKVPCGHSFCTGCFRGCCTAALWDVSLIPVNCCKRDFPLDWIERVLSPQQWAKYTRLRKDVSEAQIAKALDPEYQRSVADAGGKICPNCGQVVDLAYGCNHITCNCKYEFCFVCLNKWQTCQCELYSEEMRRRLLQAAQ